jgi:hypothetical protein
MAIVFVIIGFVMYIYAGTITRKLKDRIKLEMMTSEEAGSAESNWSSTEVQNKDSPIP